MPGFRSSQDKWIILILIARSAVLGCQPDGPEWLTSKDAQKEWRVYLGDQASSHYSALAQINKENVKHLRVAWTYHTGDLPLAYVAFALPEAK